MQHYSIEKYFGKHEEYAIAKGEDGKFGILYWPEGRYYIHWFEGLPEEARPYIVCPFEYDRIQGPIEHKRKDYDGDADYTYYSLLLDIDEKMGIFRTDVNQIVLEPIDTNKYYILWNYHGNGLVAFWRLKDKWDDFHQYQYKGFMDRYGNEVIKIDRKWNIKSGIEFGHAKISSYDHTAMVSMTGEITITGNIKHDYEDYYSAYEMERDYRAAFEDDPDAEWNID